MTGTAQPQTLTVERIHADTQYTYAPYNAYWGDYYTIQGDGAAAGQTAPGRCVPVLPAGYRPKPSWKPAPVPTQRAGPDGSILCRLRRQPLHRRAGRL